MFDLDDTLITRRVRPADDEDFEFLPKRWEEVRRLTEAGSGVVIITNQGGIAYGNSKVLPRLTNIFRRLTDGLLYPGRVSGWVCGGYDEWRKPSPRLLESYILPAHPGVPNWAYVGDMAGRPSDAGATDRCFAYNMHLVFQWIHSQRGKVTEEPWISLTAALPPTARIVFHTPESYFDKVAISTQSLGWGSGLSPQDYLRWWTTTRVLQARQRLSRLYRDLKNPGPWLILTVGPPGSGKSTLCRHLTQHVADCLVVHRDSYRSLSPYQKEAARLGASAVQVVILDATHPSRTSRRAAREAADPSHARRTVYLQMSSHIGINRLAYHWNFVRMVSGASYVPDVAYRTYAKEYTEPDPANEGVSHIYQISLPPELGLLARMRFLERSGEI
jgi:DNA 3'-phosphatase